MIVRAVFGMGLVLMGMSHPPGTQAEAASALCSVNMVCAGEASDNNDIRAAVMDRLLALKDEIRSGSNDPMVSDAAAMGDHLHRLVQRLPAEVGGR